jgi:hypothetical protein
MRALGLRIRGVGLCGTFGEGDVREGSRARRCNDKGGTVRHLCKFRVGG